MSIVNLFKERRARHYRGPEQHQLWSRVWCKHIFFTLFGLKFPLWWVTLNSKPYSEMGNFELQSYPMGWEVWPQIFVFDWSKFPTLSRSPPAPLLGHNIDSCMHYIQTGRWGFGVKSQLSLFTTTPSQNNQKKARSSNNECNYATYGRLRVAPDECRGREWIWCGNTKSIQYGGSTTDEQPKDERNSCTCLWGNQHEKETCQAHSSEKNRNRPKTKEN